MVDCLLLRLRIHGDNEWFCRIRVRANAHTHAYTHAVRTCTHARPFTRYTCVCVYIVYTNMHTCNTRIHACTHACMYSIHTSTCEYTCMQTHTHTHTHTQTHMQGVMEHLCRLSNPDPPTLTGVSEQRPNLYTPLHTHIQTCIHKYADWRDWATRQFLDLPTYIHIYIHTYIHTTTGVSWQRESLRTSMDACMDPLIHQSIYISTFIIT